MVAVNNASLHYLCVTDQLGNATDDATRNVLTECRKAYQLVYHQFEQGSFTFRNSSYQDVFDLEVKAAPAVKSCQTTFATPALPPWI
ncbi:hypothetical protein CDL15_Pgr018290 [Punica granatum]|uniref:Pectinesterase inhibitor domain-containing protein n=1 Tax=Punica granatum TaxID=22663 RepID=A0A218WHV6_PUNGR|nr:hypothetical protein CDL15_Pgr018290 [Punica granatum]PKI76104.1 hypothetical protein CRG98_003465 [Punica granatum]